MTPALTRPGAWVESLKVEVSSQVEFSLGAPRISGKNDYVFSTSPLSQVSCLLVQSLSAHARALRSIGLYRSHLSWSTELHTSSENSSKARYSRIY